MILTCLWSCSSCLFPAWPDWGRHWFLNGGPLSRHLEQPWSSSSLLLTGLFFGWQHCKLLGRPPVSSWLHFSWDSSTAGCPPIFDKPFTINSDYDPNSHVYVWECERVLLFQGSWRNRETNMENASCPMGSGEVTGKCYFFCLRMSGHAKLWGDTSRSLTPREVYDPYTSAIPEDDSPRMLCILEFQGLLERWSLVRNAKLKMLHNLGIPCDSELHASYIVHSKTPKCWKFKDICAMLSSTASWNRISLERNGGD